MKIIIGISGLAGDGKDSVCKILNKYFEEQLDYSFFKIGLADLLKEECSDACVDLFGINPLNCTREEKNKIRDFLVFYGKIMRNKTNGQHWAKEAEKKINKIGKNRKNVVFCIPDIRYAEFKNDETNWLKAQENSFLIHVKKYHFDYSDKSFSLNKVYSDPINNQEALNNPKVEKHADFVIEWQDCYPQKPEENIDCIKSVNFVAKKIIDSLIESKSLTTN